MVEVVHVEKFKSLDGYVYDTLKDAERADARWTEENQFDLETDLSTLEYVGRRTLDHMINRTFFGYKCNSKHFPRLVIFHDKHGDYHNVVANPSKLPGVYLQYLKLQQPYGFYDTDPRSRAVAKAIAETDNEFAAMAFMEQRSAKGYQYEKITAEYVPVL